MKKPENGGLVKGVQPVVPALKLSPVGAQERGFLPFKILFSMLIAIAEMSAFLSGGVLYSLCLVGIRFSDAQSRKCGSWGELCFRTGPWQMIAMIDIGGALSCVDFS